MQMDSDNSVLNLGDTSFRNVSLMVGYKDLLVLLHKNMKDNDEAWSNLDFQADFYSSVLANSTIFNRSQDRDLDTRSRTLTNALMKVGLIDETRRIGSVGEAWLNESIKEPDEFEKIFLLKMDNLVFLRQLSKVRFFNSDGNRYFRPLMFIFKFLSVYEEVPRNHFKTILHSIHPIMTEEDLNNVIINYQLVIDNHLQISEFVNDYIFAKVNSEENPEERIEELLSQETINTDEFRNYFRHGKSYRRYGYKYKVFVESLLKYRNSRTLNNYIELYENSKNGTVKSGFGFGSFPLDFKRGKYNTVEEFEHKNKDSLLLNGPLSNIYTVFRSSKHHGLSNEYSDLNIRVLNLMGIIRFDNSRVSLPTYLIFKELFNQCNIPLVGDGNYEEYENDLDSTFYQNNSFMEILNLTKSDVINITEPIIERFELDDISQLIDYFEESRNQILHELILNQFTKDNTINILNLINSREDEEVAELVTKDSDIPTIMEYMTGIAWYHLSEEKPNLRHSLNLSLDANYLPLSHASGYQGDIEIKHDDHVILIEATLMSATNQRRNELEPVIRHATNLAIDSSPKPVQTLFIGNVIDENVSNIFRASSFTTLKHSQKDEYVNGINIFSFTIKELVRLLENDKTDRDILQIIEDENLDQPETIQSGWREPIVDSILS